MSEIKAPVTFEVRLTEREMQSLANAMAGFFNVMTREKIAVDPHQAQHIYSALYKMKDALSKNGIILLEN